MKRLHIIAGQSIEAHCVYYINVDACPIILVSVAVLPGRRSLIDPVQAPQPCSALLTVRRHKADCSGASKPSHFSHRCRVPCDVHSVLQGMWRSCSHICSGGCTHVRSSQVFRQETRVRGLQGIDCTGAHFRVLYKKPPWMSKASAHDIPAEAAAPMCAALKSSENTVAESCSSSSSLT